VSDAVGHDALRLIDVNAHYGQSHVLHGVSLQLGRNGAGKTTTMLAIAGLLRTSDGQVVAGGRAIEALSPEAIAWCGVRLVPQGRRVFASLSVQENLQVARQKRSIPFPWSLERVYNLFPQLARRHRQRAGTLSGGEQQMLAIGRALMTRPRLLMLDEPSQGIMPKLVDEIFQAVKRIRDAGMTVLIVEQRMSECLEIADRAYILQTGRVLMQGSAAEISANPDVRKAYLGM